MIPRGRAPSRNPDGTLAGTNPLINIASPVTGQPNVAQINSIRPMNFDRLRIERLRQQAIARNKGENI